MVVAQARQMVLEPVQGGGGEDADLAHRPAEHAAVAQRPGDELARAGEQRPARRAQPLGERHRDHVEGRGEPVDAETGRDRRIPDPCAVEKAGDAALAGRGADALGFVLGEDDAAGAVVRVLDLDQRGRRVDAVVARLDRGDELRRAEDAARADLGELHAGIRRRAAGLVPDGVAFAADDDVVAGARQDAQRHLVGHRAAGQPERGFLAEQRGDVLLQPVGRRVFAVLVVADRCGGHGRAHLGRGTGHGVGAEVDRCGHGRRDQVAAEEARSSWAFRARTRTPFLV